VIRLSSIPNPECDVLPLTDGSAAKSIHGDMRRDSVQPRPHVRGTRPRCCERALRALEHVLYEVVRVGVSDEPCEVPPDARSVGHVQRLEYGTVIGVRCHGGHRTALKRTPTIMMPVETTPTNAASSCGRRTRRRRMNSGSESPTTAIMNARTVPSAAPFARSA
jgi:hypothetical protein